MIENFQKSGILDDLNKQIKQLVSYFKQNSDNADDKNEFNF